MELTGSTKNINNQEKSKSNIMVVIGCAAAIFFPGSLTFGFPGLMSPIWGEMLGIGPGPLSYILLFLLASLGVFMFFVGKWTNAYGVKKLMVVGAILTSLASAMVAFVSNIWMIYLWAFLVGTSSCFIYSPGINSVQQWFPHKRGLVSGLVNLTFGISAAIMVPVYRILLESIGYKNLSFLVAAIALLVGLVASQYTELPGRVSNKNNPVNQEKAKGLGTDNGSFSPMEAIKTRSFWTIWIVWALMGASGITMVTQSVRYGLHLGFTLAAASNILVVFNITNGLSRIVTGFISDIIGRNKTLSITFLLAGASYILLPYTRTLPFILPLAAVIGFGYGTLFACSAPLISDCFGLKNFGIILGLVFTSYGFLSGFIGPVASGYLLGNTFNNYKIVFTYLGILSLVSSVLVLLVTKPVRTD